MCIMTTVARCGDDNGFQMMIVAFSTNCAVCPPLPPSPPRCHCSLWPAGGRCLTVHLPTLSPTLLSPTSTQLCKPTVSNVPPPDCPTGAKTWEDTSAHPNQPLLSQKISTALHCTQSQLRPDVRFLFTASCCPFHCSNLA